MKTLQSVRAPSVRASIAPRAAAALVAAAGLGSQAFAVNIQWTGTASYSWANPANWTPFGLPTNLTDVFIGPHPAIENSHVDLTDSLTIGSLTMTDGLSLHTDWHRLTVQGDTELSGANHTPDDFIYQSGLRLGAADGYSLDTRDLTIADGATVHMSSSFVRVRRDLIIGDGCNFYGHGLVDFTDTGTTLRNDGLIQVDTQNPMHLRQFGGGLYDLDGIAGDGRVSIGTYNFIEDKGCEMRIDGDGLSDSFSGLIDFGPRSVLHMNLANGWAADANSSFTFSGYDESTVPAVIDGAGLSFAGDMRVYSHGNASIVSDSITLEPAARVTLYTGTGAVFGKSTGTQVTIEGGTYDLKAESVLEFRGDTLVRGGSFTTTTQAPEGGNVIFSGDTEIDGSVTFDGFARFEGDVTVSHPSVLSGGILEISGLTPNIWDIGNSLVINAKQVNRGTVPVRSTINVGGGFLGRLTVNLDSPGASWKMEGDLNITGDNTLYPTRIAGSGLRLTGDMNITKRAEIDARFFAHDSAVITFTTPTSALRLRGYSVIWPDTTFVGDGTIRVGQGGILVLNDGTDLGDVDLINDDDLYIGAATGVALVDNFTNTATGEWNVDIVASASGFENDLLIATGESAIMGGTLAVWYTSFDGLHLPQIGDEFTVLVTPGIVSGTFADITPISFLPGGITLEWSAIYGDHTVAVRLDNIVPAPGTAALAAATCVLGLVRRRRA